MTNNYLLLVTNRDLVSKLKNESNVTFLFPIKEFSVGFSNPFSLEEISVPHAFIFVNRILDQDGIQKFREFVQGLPDSIEGIVFDDIGVLQILREIPNHLTKILFLNHFNCNYMSVNAYLEFVDSVVLSTDITEGEVKEILDKADKPLVLYTFGHVNIMYSRRRLITNYNAHFQKDEPLDSCLTNDLGQTFQMVENEYGTVIYTGEPFNGLRYRGMNNVLYHLIHTTFLSDEEVISILHSSSNLEDRYPYAYLSKEETIVRIKERDV